MAERAARSKTAAFVQSDRRCLQGAGLEPQSWFPGGPRLLFKAGEQRFADAPPACRRAGVHPLQFGIAVEQCDGATADRRTIYIRHEKAHIRLEHLLDREAVALLGVVEGAEHLVQVRNECCSLGCRPGGAVDRDIHPARRYTRSITGAMPGPTPTNSATRAWRPPVRCNCRAAV